ncbi:transposase (plasmid) [Rhizobium sp. YTUHZ045]|uniref:transposase n=1 Tax=Rhizobium TaxID=379 RepID=UPI0039F6F0F8
MSVPGVGYLTALSFRAAVDCPARVKSSRAVGAHVGMIPRRFQSEKDNLGRISPAGHADVRATPYAAANAILMRSLHRLEQPNGMRCATDESQREAASHCRLAPPDVDRWYRVPVRIGGCSMK